MTIGDRIKNARLNIGITQETLGKSCGVAKSTINKYETNIITNIPSDKIERIADALDTTPAYLMGWTDVVNTKALEQHVLDAYKSAPDEVRRAIERILLVDK